MSSSATPLAGRRALVTGAASGLGRSIAQALSRDGADLLLLDRDEAGLADVARPLGADTWALDLADTAALEALPPLEVDIVVNNAGFQIVEELTAFPVDGFRAMQAVMVEAPFLLIRSALPHMYRGGFGRVVNVSSVHGSRASAYKAGYVTAKHGLEGLSKVVALEGAGRNTTSNCVAPGFVRTPLVESQVEAQSRLSGRDPSEVVQEVLLDRSAMKRLVEPEEVAELVCWLCGPSATSVTGATFAMDGGWSAS